MCKNYSLSHQLFIGIITQMKQQKSEKGDDTLAAS